MTKCSLPFLAKFLKENKIEKPRPMQGRGFYPRYHPDSPSPCGNSLSCAKSALISKITVLHRPALLILSNRQLRGHVRPVFPAGLHHPPLSVRVLRFTHPHYRLYISILTNKNCHVKFSLNLGFLYHIITKNKSKILTVTVNTGMISCSKIWYIVECKI